MFRPPPQRDALTAAEQIGAVAARCPVRDLTLEEPEIEDVVRTIYKHGAALESV